jgi:hypothetical protein
MAAACQPEEHLAKSRKVVEAEYGVQFPDDLFAFHDFMRAEPRRCKELGLSPEGPLALLANKRPRDDRFFNDPPEFFTVLRGPIDGLHWGYWFDQPGELKPVVVSYGANDAFEIRLDGETLFDAVRKYIELEQQAGDEHPGAREALAKHWRALRKRSETGDAYLKKYGKPAIRKASVPTRSGLGIIVDRKRYQPLGKRDPFTKKHDYWPEAADVKRFVAAARKAAADGYPGTALKLGHDLWIYRDHHAASHEMLALAYSALGRDVLKAQLARAIAYRKRSAGSR